jgi:UDP-2-acetamido-2,6-beta-L-arabino-hexul-4-ose reductase
VEHAPLTIAVTGADGFLGWHVRCALYREGAVIRPISRATFGDDCSLRAALDGADAVIHAAGVNRAPSETDIIAGNIQPATRLAAALGATGGPQTVIYANSVQSETGGAYGESKARAAELLASCVDAKGGRFVDLVLPHLFGEFGRPHYNSAVTTFAHQLAIGEQPILTGDTELELLHAQDVATNMIEAIDSDAFGRARLHGRRIDVAAALGLLRRLTARYVGESTIPSFADRFELQMFNMLRASLYTAGFYPHQLRRHDDERGAFTELCRADGLGQTSFSTSAPGVKRGEHYHVDKIERFVVVLGEARICIRRLLTTETSIYDVSGRTPAIVDMPPLCTHNIINSGEEILGTVFWAGDHFNPDNPDSYAEPVGDSAPTGESVNQ